jgi:dihydroxyacetone kinase-like protein
MVDRILEDLDPDRGGRVAVLVNSLGSTPIDELYILYRRIHTRLSERAISIVLSLVGPYATSMEMAGASLTMMVVDEELLALLNAPARCPLWRA